MKGVLWRLAKRLSCVQDARRLKVNNVEYVSIGVFGMRGFILPNLYEACYYFFS